LSQLQGISAVCWSGSVGDDPPQKHHWDQTVGNTSDSVPSVLEGYITEADLARQLNRSVRTLQRLAARRIGPPRTKVGRLIFYNIEHVRDWLLQQEQPRKPVGSVRYHTTRQLRRG
jgi:hypothetical protein